LWGHELDILNKKASQDLFVVWTAHVGSGQAHMRNGSPEKAIDDYSKAILIKTDAEILQQRANSYAKLGRFEEAIQDITSAILMDPKSAILYYNRGTAYAKRGSFSEAIADLSKAISLSTEPNADYYMNRGNALKKLGRLDAGERDLIEAKTIKNAK
jgi:tetratricopeptide (TPR) repeat protein